MNDPFLVGRLERRRNLTRDLECVGDGEGTLRQSVSQCRPLDQFQHQGTHVARVFEPVDGANIWVIERGEYVGLALEPRPPLRVFREDRRQDLDGDLAPEFGITRAIHLTHATDAERRHHFERTEACAALQLRVRCHPRRLDVVGCVVVCAKQSGDLRLQIGVAGAAFGQEGRPVGRRARQRLVKQGFQIRPGGSAHDDASPFRLWSSHARATVH